MIAGDKVNTTDREGLVVEKEPRGLWLPAGLSCELNNRQHARWSLIKVAMNSVPSVPNNTKHK